MSTSIALREPQREGEQPPTKPGVGKPLEAIKDANTSTTKVAVPSFQQGDEVVLAKGEFLGTLGVFLRLNEDPKWAEVTERDGSVRSHPVEWLAHSTTATPGREN